MNKNFFVFLILFSLIFIFGCIGGPSDQNNVNESTGSVAKGTFNANILVNGRGTNVINLLSQQNAQVGLQISNSGGSEIYNVKALLIGCIEGTANKDNTSILYPNGADYFSWTVTAPTLSQSEVINCPLTVRVCYDKISRGYTDLVFIPERYTDVVPVPTTFSDSDVLGLSFNFGIIRVLCNSSVSGTCNVGPSSNEVSGALTITNIGQGWVDYSSYTDNLGINTLRNLTINVTADNVAITKIRDVSSLSSHSGWISREGKTLTLTTTNTPNDISLLKLIQGKELYLPIRLNITDPTTYQNTPLTETLNVEISHGYCIDLAQLSATMRGR